MRNGRLILHWMISDTATEAESNFLGLTVGLLINDEVGPQPKH